MTYYLAGQSGDSYRGATVHRDRECADLGTPTRPLAESTIEATKDIEFCPNCAGGDETAVCTTELSSGGECGRDKPCPYHD